MQSSMLVYCQSLLELMCIMGMSYFHKVERHDFNFLRLIEALNQQQKNLFLSINILSSIFNAERPVLDITSSSRGSEA
ncbi:hypothetical protein A359_08720 [secondary endosymbiont of Ctenarytaina eucalypti]|uniref:Uncharacterized protein n=1 Tax=secondary endosymbiont of Ctenarytaina eucalypti TaxID=1199245 RepID=J3YSJ1_9ENTR|nr:hypothetical protein A359_08720 [secondary endosymbiont of Ctenarytaina eucalypti]